MECRAEWELDTAREWEPPEVRKCSSTEAVLLASSCMHDLLLGAKTLSAWRVFWWRQRRRLSILWRHRKYGLQRLVGLASIGNLSGLIWWDACTCTTGLLKSARKYDIMKKALRNGEICTKLLAEQSKKVWYWNCKVLMSNRETDAACSMATV